ncbi:MAG: tetratricopeptide repeat protein [Candidatus Eremiobacteraeota bacterium]|nr:tetratricopeptide repeat protein [Candidatus Eremiobacteraeota bacterium]
MTIDTDCETYRALVEQKAPLAFARHFGLMELIAEHPIRCVEMGAQILVGSSPLMPSVFLGAFSVDEHIFRWSDNNTVRSIRGWAAERPGFSELAASSFDTDALSPYEVAAACSGLTDPATTFFYAINDRRLRFHLIQSTPVYLPEISRSAVMATLRETHRYCRREPEQWAPELLRDLGFKSTGRDGVLECKRETESFSISFQSGLNISLGKSNQKMLDTAALTIPSLLVRGVKAYDEERFDLSYQVFKEVTALDPQCSKAQIYLGMIDMKQDRLELAEGRLHLATSLDSESTFAWSQLANCYDKLGRYQCAVWARSENIRLKPQDGYALAHLGRLYDELGKHDKAIVALEKAVGSRPKDVYPLRRLAGLYQKVERKDDALAAYERALLLEPDHEGTRDKIRELRE